MKRCFLLLFLLLCINHLGVAGEWVSMELCVIKWDGEGYSLFSERAVNDPGTPKDPSDDYIEPARGPHVAILDINENIIIASRDLHQLVSFNSSGELIFNFFYEASGYSTVIFENTPEKIYVDMLLRLYIQTTPGLEFVPVVNYNYEVLDKIRPFPQDPYAIINLLNWAPDGTLFFRNPRYGWITYADGKSIPGGSKDFYAADGNFYHLYKTGNKAITFEKNKDPDSFGVPKTRNNTRIDLPSVNILSAKLLNGGNGEILYVLMNLERKNHFEIWQFSLEYNVVDKLTLSNEPAYEDWRIRPFIQRDSNIYEFLCLKDGLHVIRWSKE